MLNDLIQDTSASDTVFQKALKIVRSIFPLQDQIIEHMTNDWPTCGKHLAHVLKLSKTYKYSSSSFTATLEFASLLRDSGQHMWEQSMIKTAEEVLEEAESICDACLPVDQPHPLRSSILARQSSISIDAGFSGMPKAIRNFEKAIQICSELPKTYTGQKRKLTIEDEIPPANYLNNLGCCYLHLEQYKCADPPFKRSLELKQKWANVGKMKYEFAEAYKNFSHCPCVPGNNERRT